MRPHLFAGFLARRALPHVVSVFKQLFGNIRTPQGPPQLRPRELPEQRPYLQGIDRTAVLRGNQADDPLFHKPRQEPMVDGEKSASAEVRKNLSLANPYGVFLGSKRLLLFFRKRAMKRVGIAGNARSLGRFPQVFDGVLAHKYGGGGGVGPQSIDQVSEDGPPGRL